MKIAIPVICLVLISFGQIPAQNSLVWFSFDGGFVQSSSNTSVVKSGAGQVIVGLAQQQGIQIESGFFADTLLRGRGQAYTGPIYTFRRTYGYSGGAESGYSVQQTSDSGYIVAGVTFSTPDRQAYLVKTNARGDTVWTQFVGGSGAEGFFSIRQTADGGYIATGYSNSSGQGNLDVYLVKLNGNGTTAWTRTYGSSSEDVGHAVRQTADGGYIIAGWTYRFGPQAPYLIKTNANGDTLWTRTFYIGGVDRAALSVEQTIDRGYVVAGYLHGFAVQYVDLIKTDSLGNAVWTKDFGTFGSVAIGRSVRQTIDGGYIVAGSRNVGPGSVIQLIKTNENGDSSWTRQYAGVTAYDAYSVQQTRDGGYILAGQTSINSGTSDVFLIKASITGDSLWAKTIGGPADERGYEVEQTFDGGYIIVGETSSFGAGNYDVYLIKTDDVGFVTSVGGAGQVTLPVEFRLYQNYPNPFNPSTTIAYDVKSGATVDLAVFDILGREVLTLEHGFKTPGSYHVSFDMSQHASGVYFYRLQAGRFADVKKMLLLK